MALPGLEQAQSLPQAFFATADRIPDRPAQWRRQNAGYTPVSYRKLADRVRRVASALIRAGVAPGERVALLMENRPEWAVADYAIMSIGAVTVPLYCSFGADDMAYVLQDSGAAVAIALGERLTSTLMEALDACPSVRSVYAVPQPGGDARLHAFDELEQVPVDAAALASRLQPLTRQTLATLVYTSGTTGHLKGVMLSHGNFLANLETVPAIVRFEEEDRMLSVLPLAHSLERFASHFMPYSFGLSVAFAERPGTISRDLAESAPSLMIAVPRLLEVMRERVMSRMARQPSFVQRVFHTYLVLAQRRRDDGLSAMARLGRHILDRTLGRAVRARFGGRLRLLVSGGAPLGSDVGAFFEALGLPVLEGYGLTESASLVSVNSVDARRAGTVGRPVRGVSVRLAADGEILVQGGNIMQGYWQQREMTETALVDGWFHTGDVGRLDTDGYLYITDRKKDIIVNSGGKNIAPQRIEHLLMADAMIEQAVVYGDRRPYLVALIVPAREQCLGWAEKGGMSSLPWSELVVSEPLKRVLQQRVWEVLRHLSRHEQVRRIAVHDVPFSVDDGLMTPTLKIRRHRVYERFREIFEGLY